MVGGPPHDGHAERDVLEQLRGQRVNVHAHRQVGDHADPRAAHEPQHVRMRDEVAAEHQPLGHPDLLGAPAHRGNRVAGTVDLEAQRRQVTRDLRRRVYQQLDAVQRCDGPVVDDPEAAVAVASGGRHRLGEHAFVHGVHHDRELALRHAATDQLALVGLVHRHHLVGEPRGEALDAPEDPFGDAGAPPAVEALVEHLGAEVMDVEDHARPEQLGHHRREHKEVRRVVDVTTS